MTRELVAELAFNGQGLPSWQTKHDLRRLYAEGRIGWRAQAVHTYLLIQQLCVLQMEMRNMVSALSGKRQPKVKPISFTRLFNLPEESADLPEGQIKGVAEFEWQVDDDANG